MYEIPQPIAFDWDAGNKDKNQVRHKTSLQEIEEAFCNKPLLVFSDDKHSTRETRNLLLGTSTKGRLLSIIFTLRGSKVRVISARDMSKKERIIYEKEAKTYTKI